MWAGDFRRAWLLAYLILADRALALRRSGGDGDRDPLITPSDWGFSLGVAPPAWTAGGCIGKRGDRCEWLLCKHEGAKIRLAREKYESDVQVLGGAADKTRHMSEEQTQRYLEKQFLRKKITGVHMYAAVERAFEGEAKNCVWASGALTRFEAWLKELLPARHACVTDVVALHAPTEQICSEVFTNEFKRALNKACQEDLEPRDEGKAGNLWKKIKNNATRYPYEVANFADTAFAATGTFSALLYTGLGAVGMLALGFGAWAFAPAVALFAITVPDLAKAICKLLDQRRASKKAKALTPLGRIEDQKD